jgi:pSer/pThr/pTyr-binding forkhead associated (FHA) protein
MATVRELVIEHRSALRERRNPAPGPAVLIEAAQAEDVVLPKVQSGTRVHVWSTERFKATPGDIERHEQARRQQLIALQDLVEDASEVHEIRKTENNPSPHICVGRATRNDIVIEDTTISSLHAVIDTVDGTHLLTDRESSNGTFLNKKRLEGNESVPLQTGDCLRFGRRVLYYLSGDRLPNFLGLRIVKRPPD